MSHVSGPSHEPMVGENVMLLVHTDDRPTWATARICQRSPFTVEFGAETAQLFKGTQSVLVIHDSGRKYTKGEGKVSDLCTRNEKAWLTFEGFHWQAVDNRDNPRFETEVKAVVRTINEDAAGITADDQFGLTQNLSLGGALVKLSKPVNKGQLLEVRMNLSPGNTIRAMAIVAHTDVPGTLVGLSFVDYIGSARYSIHQYLTSLAA